MIKEIIAVLKDDVKDIVFRMDLGYFSEEIIEVIESVGYHYLIKAKHYGTFPALAYSNDKKIVWDKYDDEKEITSRIIKPDAWNQGRNFIITRKKKVEQKVIQEKMFEYDEYDHDFYVTNMDISANEEVDFYKKMLV
ncbi:Transposase DDE domain protein [Clostridium ljungdahlii]|uniref:Transposase DDE domain protein n=1 Tax=Clostridium ljungdahlii TaxID=1538 RepID=A0A162ND09_9CLOT|nr:Transposase DDE domain protein [Clostridium ljungdahlii]